MKIMWSIDNEDREGVIPDDLLGSIYICHNDACIQDDVTYLDSWFDSLIDGYHTIARGNTYFESDLIDEPDPLYFERIGNNIKITYKNTILEACPLDKFFMALLDSASKLVTLINKEAPEKNKTMIKKIEDFIRKHTE